MNSQNVAILAPPQYPVEDILAHEKECRIALRPWVKGFLDRAESVGWDRRTVASTLMFLAAQHLSAARDPAGQA
ncbi:hypothetical protein FQ775_19345 [Nitratireductor mangrovi]|uniref:Uncharacterized protein n=1 Tax=Nitratireductor mangrovi TaxID=2599600 RepID=A0A5B8L464_9HYPH|nr:hypothetical protein [Nitratireductor mangrovi]QDZ02358.1 hypothetical protein FQ775_19345 [Nitratireductor mangrovi]